MSSVEPSSTTRMSASGRWRRTSRRQFFQARTFVVGGKKNEETSFYGRYLDTGSCCRLCRQLCCHRVSKSAVVLSQPDEQGKRSSCEAPRRPQHRRDALRLSTERDGRKEIPPPELAGRVSRRGFLGSGWLSTRACTRRALSVASSAHGSLAVRVLARFFRGARCAARRVGAGYNCGEPEPL